MPFQSQAQAGWAFATGQPFARRWARETGPYKRLPKRKRKTYTVKDLEDYVATDGYSADVAQSIAGQCEELPRLKGEQISPGVTRIRGELCNVHGKYGRCPGGASAAPAKPVAKPKKGGRARKPAKGAKPKDPAAVARQQELQRRQDLRFQQQQQDRISRQMERTGREMERRGREQAKLQKQQEQEKKPKGGGGGGKGGAGAKPKPTDEEKRQSIADKKKQTASETAAKVGLKPDDIIALRDAAEGLTSLAEPAGLKLLQMGFADDTGLATDQGRRALSALERGDVRGYQAALQDARARQGRESAAGQRRTEAERRRTETEQRRQQRAAQAAARRAESERQRQAREAERKQRQAERDAERKKRESERTTNRRKAVQTVTVKAGSPGDYLVVEDPKKSNTWHLQVKRNGKPDHGLMGGAWAALHGGYRGNKYQGPNKAEALSKLRALYKSEKMPLPSEKSFTVFKQSDGRYRWVAFSSNAYQDRDKEIVSTKALEADCARADQDGNYGPLRWWHVPGVELGMCDFNAMHGRILVESGTFKSKRIGEVVAANADNLRMSIGFNHPPTEPDGSGIFHNIKRFERSLVPMARASNPWTALQVTKEQGMFDSVKQAALKALGFSDEEISGLSVQATETQKAAEESGATYKDAPEWAQALITRIEALEASYKALPPPPTEEPPADQETELMADGMADEGMMEESAGGLTLSPEDLTAIGQAVSAALQTALAPLVGAMDMGNKMGAHMAELKTMMQAYQGGQAQKDDARATEIAAIDSRVKALEGDIPAGVRGHRIEDNPPMDAARRKQIDVPPVGQTSEFPFGDIIAKLNQNGAGLPGS